MNTTRIIATTGDLKQDYEIISPIFLQIANRGILKNHLDKLAHEHKDFLEDLTNRGILSDKHIDTTGQHMEQAFYMGLEELKTKAEKMGGNALIYLRYDTDILQSSSDFYLQLYGTVVKFV